jgi:hypothetical protein
VEQSEGATATNRSSTPGQKSSNIDTTVPQSARIWNYWLGGKDNYRLDREIGDQFREIFPDIIPVARASRAFIARSVRYLAGEAGIRQFLDIGTGLPSANNTHSVLQRVARTRALSTSTTIPWCWRMPAPYSPAPPKARVSTSTRTCANPTRFCKRPSRRWTSANRSRSC